MGDMIGLREFYEEGVIITTDGSIEPLSIEVVDMAVNDVLRFVKSRPSQPFLILTKRSKSLFAYDLAIQNLWVGVTICKQDEVWKLEDLVQSNAINKWLSIEPMIGEVKFNPNHLSQVGWVVCGGERTRKAEARPLKFRWVESLFDACKKIEVPFFFKQEGAVNDFIKYGRVMWDITACKQLPVSLQPRNQQLSILI
jgi:protein gp37